MTYIAVSPPAGLYRNGTVYQAKGRWYDANLIRFEQDAIGPVGGWQLRSLGASAFTGTCRALQSWRDNSNNRWIAVGSEQKLYVQSEGGTNYDITPVGFTVGRQDATQNLGFGGGTYGTGFYGVARPSLGSFLPASMWSLDSWGEDLVGCCDSDGKIYLWTLNTASAAAVVSGAPTSCASILVTAEGILMALGAGGLARRVQWCDQQAITTWTPAATNQAGDYDLSTVGTIQCGKALPSGALILTDVDAWLASYIGAPLVYGFERVGSGCGIVSKGALAAQDARAVWMGKGGTFWLFDGQSVRPLDCDVHDYAANINTNQISKVAAVHLAEKGEVWWFFPSASSNENDSYVAWCYRESARLGRNIWTFGSLSRLCGSGRGVFPNPMMVDGSGYLWEHEAGWNWGGATPYLESGPIEIGQGEFMAEVQMVVPDQVADGDVSLSFYGRSWPDGPDTVYGPYSAVSPTNVLFQATQLRVRFTGAVNSGWRVGSTRLSVVPGDPADFGLAADISLGGGYDFTDPGNSGYL